MYARVNEKNITLVKFTERNARFVYTANIYCIIISKIIIFTKVFLDTFRLKMLIVSKDSSYKLTSGS